MLRNRINLLALVLLVAAISSLPIISWSQKPGTSSPIKTARGDVARGHLEGAEKNVWTVLSSDPNNLDALTLLGISRGRQKRYSEAEALLRRVLQLDPKSLVAQRNLASALIAENKGDEALEVDKGIAKASPQDVSANLELARLYVARGQFSDALTALNAIPAVRFPVEGVPTKAAALLGDRRPAEAGELISRVKNSPALAADLAEVFLYGNAPELALKALDEGSAGSKQPSVRLCYLKGRALQATGADSAAAAAFADVLARDPKSVEALVSMASIDSAGNRHSESLKLLMRAYAVQPASVFV